MTSMKIIQINTARSVTAMVLAYHYASAYQIDMLIISEPNIKTVCRTGWDVAQVQGCCDQNDKPEN